MIDFYRDITEKLYLQEYLKMPQQIKYHYHSVLTHTVGPGQHKKNKNKRNNRSLRVPTGSFTDTIGLYRFLWEYYSDFSLYGRFNQAYNAIISSNKGPVYRVYQHKLFKKIIERDISAISRL